MANAKESFDIIVQNGSFTLRSLVYEDELLRLDGFYQSESDNGVYIHEQLLSNNQPTKYNPAKALTAANGVSYKIYKSAEARANALDSEAYGEFDLSTVSVKHGDNYFYLRADFSHTVSLRALFDYNALWYFRVVHSLYYDYLKIGIFAVCVS